MTSAIKPVALGGVILITTSAQAQEAAATTGTAAGIDAAIEAVTGVGTVDIRNFGSTSTTTIDDTGFEVRFTGAPYAGTDVAALGLAPASGDVSLTSL